ncbi:MAG: peptidylprolyl isomerase [Candidatus Omnitrophica bacterium]|nr:peptidylprolyl isomerase [Candidatus Omnitrophota bacterium]MBD3269621.1 peptidylprolyl isomerase [Candidatus Omnitrophota bacterium]
MKNIIGIAVTLLFFLQTVLAQGGSNMIQDGSKVKFDYTLTVEGEVVDTSKGKEPLEYTQGQGQIIPGLEDKMQGLKTGDEKTIEVEAANAYGEVNPKAVQEVPKNMFPEDLELKPGMVLPLKDNEDRRFTATVREIKQDSVVLDLNHPLAGKDLVFDVKIVSVE